MAYIKLDTPRLTSANAFMVYVGHGDPICFIHPTITVHTAIDSVVMGGAENKYTDTNTGITIEAVLNNGIIEFRFTHDGESRVTGSSSFNITVRSLGDDEYSPDTATFTLGLVCCAHDLDPASGGETDMYVSGRESTIYTGMPLADIKDGSNTLFTADSSTMSFHGIPDTPAALVGLTWGDTTITNGYSVASNRPHNIAIKDNRIYTDQEYIIAVEDPNTALCNRSNIKIHSISPVGSDSADIPFIENPGNGYYINGVFNGSFTYKDEFSDSHTYTIEKTGNGSDNGEDVRSCPYYIGGACSYGNTCFYTNGIRTLTNSTWALKHNGSEVATAESVYDSEVPPSSGWGRAVITGESEVQYNGNVYAYAASYTSVDYRPSKSMCTRLEPHTLYFYKVQEFISKSFDGWGQYGGTSRTGTPAYLTYDADTGLYSEGIRTTQINEGDIGVISGVSALTGAGLMIHPVTASHLDQALAIKDTGVAAGYGTSSGPYGVAVPDSNPNQIMPTYDWAQFYTNRPRTAVMIPPKGSHKVSQTDELTLYSKIYAYYYKNIKTGYKDISPYYNRWIDWSKSWVVNKGFLEKDVKDNRILSVTSVKTDKDTASLMLPYYTGGMDIPQSFFNVGEVNLKVYTEGGFYKYNHTIETQHRPLLLSEYIMYDDILYKRSSDDNGVLNLTCEETYSDIQYPDESYSSSYRDQEGPLVFDDNGNRVPVRVIVNKKATWTAVIRDYMHWIHIDTSEETESNGHKKPLFSVNGTINKNGVPIEYAQKDIIKSGTIPAAVLRTVGNTYLSAYICLCKRTRLIPYRDKNSIRPIMYRQKYDGFFWKLIIPGVMVSDESYSFSISYSAMRGIKPESLVRTYGVRGSYDYIERQRVTKGGPVTAIISCGDSSDSCEQCLGGLPNWVTPFCCSHEKNISATYTIEHAFSIDQNDEYVIVNSSNPGIQDNLGTATYSYNSGVFPDCDGSTVTGSDYTAAATARISNGYTIFNTLSARAEWSNSKSTSYEKLNTTLTTPDTLIYPLIVIGVSISPPSKGSIRVIDCGFSGNDSNYDTMWFGHVTDNRTLPLMYYNGYPYKPPAWYGLNSLQYDREYTQAPNEYGDYKKDCITYVSYGYTITSEIDNTLLAFDPRHRGKNPLWLYFPTDTSIISNNITKVTSRSIGADSSCIAPARDDCSISETVHMYITPDSAWEDPFTDVFCIGSGGKATTAVCTIDPNVNGYTSNNEPSPASALMAMYPFEAPYHGTSSTTSGGTYRAIVASAKAHYDVSTSVYVSHPLTTEYSYKYTESSDSDCKCDYYYESSSASASKDYSQSMSNHYADTPSVCTTSAVHIPYNDAINGSVVSVDTTSRELDKLYKMDKNIIWHVSPGINHLFCAGNFLASGDDDKEFKFTIVWTTRPVYKKDASSITCLTPVLGTGVYSGGTLVGKHYYLGPADEVIGLLPDISDSTAIYESKYTVRLYDVYGRPDFFDPVQPKIPSATVIHVRTKYKLSQAASMIDHIYSWVDLETSGFAAIDAADISNSSDSDICPACLEGSRTERTAFMVFIPELGDANAALITLMEIFIYKRYLKDNYIPELEAGTSAHGISFNDLSSSKLSRVTASILLT